MHKVADKHTYEYLKITYFVRFIADAFFYTFLFVFLSYIGSTSAELGLLSAVMPLAAFFGNLLFSRIAKNLEINRRLMVLLTVAELLVAIIFTVFNRESFLFYLVIVTFVSFFNGPFYALLDGYSGTYILERNKQYSSMRIMGTLGYVFAPFFGGILVDQTNIGYPIIFGLSSFFFVLTLILLANLPRPVTIKSDDTEVNANERINIFANPPLFTHLLFSLLIIPLSIVSDNFYGVYLTDILKMSTTNYGYLFSAAIIVEILMFIFIIFKKNMFNNPAFSYFLIGLAILLRPLSVALNFGELGVFMLGIFRGVAWGYYLVFHVRYLSKILPLRLLTSALFLTSLATTLGRFIFSLSIGAALDNFSYSEVFSVISGVVIASTILLMGLSLIYQQKNNKKEHH